jgi:hypothetical protein
MSLESWKTPNYQIEEDHRVVTNPGSYETKLVPKYTFVRPIDYYYVPRHIKEDERYRYFNPETEIFCYCPLGIHPFPKKIVRKV